MISIWQSLTWIYSRHTNRLLTALLLLILTSLLLAAVNVKYAMAAELSTISKQETTELEFIPQNSPKLGSLYKFKINKWLEDNSSYLREYDVAFADINNDQIDEIFVRLYPPKEWRESTIGTQMFHFLFFADKLDSLELIGETPAITIKLSKNAQDSIKSILSCRNPVNDFACVTMTYNPEKGIYE